MADLYTVTDMHLSLADMVNKPLFGAAPRIDILHGLSFSIKRGEVLGIVGGSGSGKSTLGRVLVRLLEASQGQVLFDGQDITHLGEDALRPLRRRFQMIFQDPMSSLNPRRTVAGIIAGPLQLHGFDRVSARVDQALDHVGLPRTFRNRYPHELSGGQRQRVGIARAIAIEPEFILADEIVSGLDVSSQAQVLKLLADLVRDLGLTLAFISHDLSVIRRLCGTVMVLHQGRIVEHRASDALFAAPEAAYTRALLDSIPLPDPDQPWSITAGITAG
ncbi:ATP-binding cassette domain-containing protein [Pararhodobacter sp.]|uniref:ATP-binding cassette domain-containing protein n=1 Tax=Pararhodobacter sp. TaxID=2127056 RepID=UPI002FDDE0CF